MMFKSNDNKYKFSLKIKFFLIIFLILTISILFSYVNSFSILYSGNFNLNLNDNDCIGSQLLEYHVIIQYLNTMPIHTPINTTANIYGIQSNEVYSSTLEFIPNTDGKMKILTNLNETENHIIKVSINQEETLMANGDIFMFEQNDNIIIWFEVTEAVITKTHINAILGIIGIGLFCANPILSYILTDKAKDKFKFLFFLMAIGIIAIGLALGFIYEGT